ncbi:tyrosine-type recombinase/integrase [Pseudomonas sp.]|uniref:tyrosine-type recombinase/integrase n=1 Tax=Pseudomonas sp. TaxID=306 RepID=UPI0025E2C2C3|nr:tyrosine-type recombinase/integrase [Pseudomonas sp.]
MTTPANQDQVSPPSPSSAYVFQGPPRVAIRARTNDQPRYVNTQSTIWKWYDGGLPIEVNWEEINLNSSLLEIFKGFIAHSLEKYAPRTVEMFSRLIKRMSKSGILKDFPWEHNDVVLAATRLSDSRHALIGFRVFYRWALSRGLAGFNQGTYLAIKEIKSDHVDQYSRIFLSQTGLDLNEEVGLLKRIEREAGRDGWINLQSNILLHLGFELAPRLIQFHALDISDFEMVRTSGPDTYYTLWLPMAKKIGQRRPERRPRKITSPLGEKIESHISELNRRFGSTCEALFVSPAGKRLSVIGIGTNLKNELREAGIERPNQVSMLLRHHLGQGLADQGTPAELIAELLGHNSTVAARAYVTATPNIARIKEKALGKSPSYQRIMRSLLTGEIVRRRDTEAEREVRGVVDMQYIGDIGACALPTHTHCPYNPVYACYTCKKFHPFADGRHEQVKEALQREAQRFIDVAEQAGEPQHNRTLAQHQATILAVTATIERCQGHIGESEFDSV